MADPPIGYVFGYASLADADDPLVTEVRGDVAPVYGHMDGFRRAWNAGMENRAPLNDAKHYVDSATGERLDIVVVALNLVAADGRINGVAVPVTAGQLPRFDKRELHYDRIDVSDRFSEPLDLPVWTYVGDADARADYERGRAAGRAFIRRAYHDRVLAVFRRLGHSAWTDFAASTDPPACPLRDLEHVTPGAAEEHEPAP